MNRRTAMSGIFAGAIGIIAVPDLFAGAGGVADWKAVMPRVFASGDEFYEVGLGESAPGETHIYIAAKKAEVIGYGVELPIVSMSGRIRLLVMINHKHRVKYIYILNYPHKHGAAVKTRSFLKQFDGTKPGETLKAGDQIDIVTGATSSCKAVTRGVNKALKLFEAYIQSEAATE